MITYTQWMDKAKQKYDTSEKLYDDLKEIIPDISTGYGCDEAELNDDISETFMKELDSIPDIPDDMPNIDKMLGGFIKDKPEEVTQYDSTKPTKDNNSNFTLPSPSIMASESDLMDYISKYIFLCEGLFYPLHNQYDVYFTVINNITMAFDNIKAYVFKAGMVEMMSICIPISEIDKYETSNSRPFVFKRIAILDKYNRKPLRYFSLIDTELSSGTKYGQLYNGCKVYMGYVILTMR